MAQVKRRINGLSNIHIAVMDESTNVAGQNPTYATPVPVKGAISTSVSLNYGDVAFYADNTVRSL